VRDLLIALRPDWLAFRNSFMAGSAKKKLSAFGQIGVLVVVAWLIAVGAFKATVFAREVFGNYLDLLHLIELNLLSSVSLAGFVFLLMTGVRDIYSSFYESGDLAYLLSTPLRVEAVFFAKLFKSMLSNLLILAMFEGAAFAGYGAAYGAGALYYPAALVSLVFASALFTALSSALVMVIMRFVPGQRMKQLVMVASLSLSAVFLFISQWISARTTSPSDSIQLLQSAGQWQLGKMNYMPHVWLAKTVIAFAKKYDYGMLESFVPLAAAGIVSVLIAGFLAKHTFLTGWSSSQEVEARRRRRERAAVQETGREGRSVPSAAESQVFALGKKPSEFLAVLRKDLLVLLRTPTMWYSIVVVLIVMGFMGFNISRSSGIDEFNPEAAEVEATALKALLLFMSLFMGASVNARSGSIAVSLEGNSWWMIQSMPIRPGAYYRSKLAFSFLTSSAVSLLAIAVLSLMPNVPSYPLYISIPVVIAVGSVLAASSLLIDIFYPDFSLAGSLNDPTGRRRNVPVGRQMISLVVSVLPVLLFGAVFAFPFYYSGLRLFAWVSPSVAKAVTVAVFIGLTIAANWVCYALGTKRLSQMFVGA